MPDPDVESAAPCKECWANCGVPADEDRLLDAIFVAVLEELSGASEVDAVTLFSVGREVRHRCHVNERVGAGDSEHVFGRALSNVGLMHFDTFGHVGPRTAVDADDLVPAADEPIRNTSRQRAADPGDQDLHGLRSFSGPGMRSNMNDRGRASSPVLISRSIA